MESKHIAYFRNFVFGVEDSLVSTVGLLSGVAIAGLSTREIFLTGMILIFVEAVSMAAGTFLAESSAEEYFSHRERLSRKSYGASAIMLVSFFVTGFIPLLPYIFLPVSSAFSASIIVSLLALALLGIVSAKLTKTRMVVNGVRMAVVGGLAIAVGVVVGHFFG